MPVSLNRIDETAQDQTLEKGQLGAPSRILIATPQVLSLVMDDGREHRDVENRSTPCAFEEFGTTVDVNRWTQRAVRLTHDKRVEPTNRRGVGCKLRIDDQHPNVRTCVQQPDDPLQNRRFGADRRLGLQQRSAISQREENDGGSRDESEPTLKPRRNR